MESTSTELMKWFATLGIGGVLAGFMFVFYRKDIQQYTELWKGMATQLLDVVKDNTASNTKLISLLESMERNQMRKADVEDMIHQRITDRFKDRDK